MKIRLQPAAPAGRSAYLGLGPKLLILFASTVVLAGGLSAGSADGSRNGAVSGTGLVALSSSLWEAGNTSRYSLVIVNTSNAQHSTELRGLPLVYFAAPDVNKDWNAGVSYHQAVEHNWLLKDANGNVLVNQGYPSNVIGDVGNPAYEAAWVSNVLAFLHAHRNLKGVFIDEVLTDLTPLTGEQAERYPTQQSWATAQLAFIAKVGSTLRAKGYYVLVNASGYIPGDSKSNSGANTVAWWHALGPYVSGLGCEYWLETGDGSTTLRSSGTSSWTQYWGSWQRLVSTAQSMGKDFVGLMSGSSSDSRAMAYGKASFLLDWNGGRGAFVYLSNDNPDPWNAAWTTNVGMPASRKQHVGNGWLRRYAGGVALVNPDPTESQTFSLDGRYITSDGAAVSTVTLPPVSGLVLRSAPATKSADS